MTVDYQATYNGVTVGLGQTYGIYSIDGFDDFQARRITDQTLPNLWGAQAAGVYIAERTITLGVQLDDPVNFDGTVDAAFTPPPQTDPTRLLPLTVKFPDRIALISYGRITRRARPRTPSTEVSTVRWLYEFTAPDPRLYDTVQRSTVASSYLSDSTVIDLATSSGVNLATDLTLSSGADLAKDFSGVAAAGGIVVTNAGNVDTYPAFHFTTTSNIATWHVINDTTLETASFAFALGVGHEVVADMAGVATGSTVPPVTYDGAANYPIWVAPRVPIRLVPGNNAMRFFVDSGTAAGATCTVVSRDAYL